jgi:hypothetical protein
MNRVREQLQSTEEVVIDVMYVAIIIENGLGALSF